MTLPHNTIGAEVVGVTLEERLARLEALVERFLPAQADDAPPPPATPPDREEPQVGRDVASLLAQSRRPGRRMVLTGVGHWTEHSSATATSAKIWDEADPIQLDYRRAAALCQALGSEARLMLLCDLLPGAKTTGELTGSTGLERGQLYHHLRDLFVEGLVEQPERGRYQLTGRGEVVLLLTAVLTDSSAPEQLTGWPEELAADTHA